MNSPPNVDLATLTPQRLRDLGERYAKAGYDDLARACLAELEKRGAARMSDYSHLRWNAATAREALQPFAEIARSIEGNKRTPFTEAGGTKIGLTKNHPGHNWVDSYSGIKRGSVNAIFVCYIKSPGDDPEFRLLLNGIPKASFNSDEIDSALVVWNDIADSARAG